MATALLTLLLGVVYGAYTQSARSVSRCQEGFAPVREGLKVQRVLDRILAAASASRQPNSKAIFTGDDRRLKFTTFNRQGRSGAGCPLGYVEISHERANGLIIVTHPTKFLYDRLEKDPEDRLEFPGVSSLEFKYWDDTDWIREWEATKKGKLPTRVRVLLRLAAAPGGQPLKWIVEVPVPTVSELPLTSGAPPGPGLGVPNPFGSPPPGQGGF